MLLKINVTVPTLGIKFDPTFPNVRDTVTKLGFAIQNEWIKVAESRVNRVTGEYINQLKFNFFKNSFWLISQIQLFSRRGTSSINIQHNINQ